MYKFIHSFALLLAFFVLQPAAQAQKVEYTDHKPQYRKWQDSYIIDKIEYTKDRTIFYFRFVHEYDPFSGITTEAVFYPTDGEYPWYLKGITKKQNFELIEIRDVRRNGQLLASKVRSELRSPALEKQNTVFTCQVHFPRLPNDIEFVDFIEGRGKESATNHFNCFNVKLKTEKSKELGDKKDSDKNAKEFNEKYKVKPDPKPEPEPIVVKKDTTKTEEPKKIVLEEPKPDKENKYGIPRLREKNDIRCNENMVMDRLKFADNSPELMNMAEAQRQMLILHEFLTDHPQVTMTVIGHTDIFGNAKKNMELSRERARKVQQWFSGKGIAPRRIKVEWHGIEKPLKPEGGDVNRRVEFILHCNDK
jgi:outer membrane protein OmpA-like peptidoglycan-associated protein